MKTLIDHALELFSIVKSGELLEKKSRALWLAGQILVLASEFFPESVPFGDQPPNSLDLEEAIALAEKEIDATSEAPAVSPLVVALVTRVIVLVLRRLLS